jgi:hypothetical protein
MLQFPANSAGVMGGMLHDAGSAVNNDPRR